MDQTLSLSAQYFVRETKDLIIFADNRFINRDRQNDRGIELSADWSVTNRLSLGGWYNYLDGEITTQGENGEVSQDNLIRRPTHSIGFRAGVEALDNLTLRLNGEYNGERSDIFFNPENGFAPKDVSLDPYLLVNLYAEYALLDGQVSVFADAKNLLNSDFTEVYGFNTMGRNILAGAKVNF
jgi:vitamin B12 transporter